jgi:hypothetical protein
MCSCSRQCLTGLAEKQQASCGVRKFATLVVLRKELRLQLVPGNSSSATADRAELAAAAEGVY